MVNQSNNFYVYIVECSDRTYYTGWTVDLETRLAQHNTKRGAKYTRSRTPVVLKYVEEFPNKVEAMRREYKIKKMTRTQKQSLLNESVNNS